MREHEASRRTVLRVIVVTQVLLAILTGAVVAVGYQRLSGNIDTIPGVPEEDRPDEVAVEGPRKPLNILVMGTDERSGDNAIDGEAGSGGADVTILLHVSADRKDAYGVSLPRDAMVARPDCVTPNGDTVPGEDPAMFNTALAVGGPTCMIQTVESLTDVRIHHAVLVDFSGFVDMVDAVDGVEVCIPKDVDDPRHNIFLAAGTQTLDGRQALDYVRERTQLSLTGDIGRMKRQQAFIASMVNKLFSSGTLTRPDRVYNFLKAATDSMKLDEELDDIPALMDLAMQFRQTGLDDIRFVTVPFEAYPADPNRLQWAPEARRLWERIRRDQPLGRFSEGSISAARPPGSSASPTDTPSGPPSAGGTPGTSPSPDASPTTDEAARAEALANGLCP